MPSTLPARTYASTSIELGDYVNRVARAQIALGNYPRAEQLYRESLAIREKAAGPDSLAAAESIGGLARVALLSNDNAAVRGAASAVAGHSGTRVRTGSSAGRE